MLGADGCGRAQGGSGEADGGLTRATSHAFSTPSSPSPSWARTMSKRMASITPAIVGRAPGCADGTAEHARRKEWWRPKNGSGVILKLMCGRGTVND